MKHRHNADSLTEATGWANSAAYDAWYDSQRGRWIGETEFSLLCKLLMPQAGASLLDVGCGSG